MCTHSPTVIHNLYILEPKTTLNWTKTTFKRYSLNRRRHRQLLIESILPQQPISNHHPFALNLGRSSGLDVISTGVLQIRLRRFRHVYPPRGPFNNQPVTPSTTCPRQTHKPVDSIRDAVFTVSPKRQYRGIVSPTTPAQQGPVCNPILKRNGVPGRWRIRNVPLWCRRSRAIVATCKSIVFRAGWFSKRATIIHGPCWANRRGTISIN